MPLPAKLSRDESRAIAFVGLLLAVSAGARLAGRPGPLEVDAPLVDTTALEAAGKERQELERPLDPGDTIDPNSASAEQLARLPGAGRALAERIIAERSRESFRTVDDLRRVRGIGPATVEKWAPYLRLPPATPARTAGSSAPGMAGGPSRVDLNRATAAELERLPGIGAVLAARIVAWRDSVGRFTAVEQLENVRGVGPAMMRRLAPLVRIGG